MKTVIIAVNSLLPLQAQGTFVAGIFLSLLGVFTRNRKQRLHRDLGPGSSFDRYRIVKHLKEGGMASVYTATDAKTGATVALKVMHQSLVGNAELVTKFLQEGDTLERIKRHDPHAPVVAVYRHSRENNDPEGRPFLALEHIRGEDLGDVLRSGRKFTHDEALFVITVIARALRAAHQERVWHRDLSPGNVLVESDEHAKLTKVTLIDFGVARNEYLSPVTPDGSIVGKPPYMSPEQCGNKLLDGRSDIYSLGILFYTLLTGRPPFLSNRPLDVMRMHEKEPVPPLATTFPAWMRTVVTRMLEKDPQKRYQSIEDMMNAMTELRSSDEPTSVYQRQNGRRPEVEVRKPGEKATPAEMKGLSPEIEHERQEYTSSPEPFPPEQQSLSREDIDSAKVSTEDSRKEEPFGILSAAVYFLSHARFVLPVLALVAVIVVVLYIFKLPPAPESAQWRKRGIITGSSSGSAEVRSPIGQVDSTFYLLLEIPRRYSHSKKWIGVLMENLKDGTICRYVLRGDTCYFRTASRGQMGVPEQERPLAAIVGSGGIVMAVHHVQARSYLYLTGDLGITQEPLRTTGGGPIRLSVVQTGDDFIQCAYELQSP